MHAPPATGAVLGRDDMRSRMLAFRRTRPGGLVLYALAIALVAVAYYLAGRIGLELAYLNGAVAAIWPPAGLGLAVLFLYGFRLWPGIVIGDLWLRGYSWPFAPAHTPTGGYTLPLVLAAPLARRPA